MRDEEKKSAVANTIPKGYITDFISGMPVLATPEEVDAVQVFSKILVEDYGYPKSLIQTRPQYRVRKSPSDTNKSLPVDIAVFSNKLRLEEHEYIIVECKRKERKDGLKQLKQYLTLSDAYIGVWFNGKERAYIEKIISNGKVDFKQIPNIPMYGFSLEDLAALKRCDLKPIHNLKIVFTALRSYVAGNATGTGRDEKIAQQLINIIFCKVYDEKFTHRDQTLRFRAGANEKACKVKERILQLFDDVKKRYKDVFSEHDVIDLNDSDLTYIVGELQNYCMMECERDVLADAFETFIGYSLKGSQGQFFTPRNVIDLMVKIIDPKDTEELIDPAFGSGGFLISTLRYVWEKIDESGKSFDWADKDIEQEKHQYAGKALFGIEKDDFLCKVTKAYMAILGDGKGGLFCEDSLDIPKEWKPSTQEKIKIGKFDILLANPPFGKDIKVEEEAKLRQYTLAHKKGKLCKSMNVQILFIERSLALLKDGGRMGFILPETYFHSPSTKQVRDFLLKGNNVQFILDLPHNTFRPHNNAKCIAVFIQKNRPQQSMVRMAVAEQVGHDHNGKVLYRWDYKSNERSEEVWDDIPAIIREVSDGVNRRYCFDTNAETMLRTDVLVPRYYWRNAMDDIAEQARLNNCTLVPIRKLLEDKILKEYKGQGSPEGECKGKGNIPYIRVKDIVNWEVYKDPTAMIPERTYEMFMGKRKAYKPQEKDIAFVRRGSYRIGSVAMLSRWDIQALYTGEITFIRVNDTSNEWGIDPYYLLFLLAHPLVKRQIDNKVLMETTLPNIADRWKELYLPISNDINERRKISQKVEGVINSKWEARKQISDIEDLFNLKLQ